MFFLNFQGGLNLGLAEKLIFWDVTFTISSIE